MRSELPIVGRGMGFFKVNVAVAAEALERWRRSHAWFAKWPPGLVVEHLEGELSSGVDRLLPFGPERDRELLWDCGDGQWTAYFDSMPASDAVTAVRGLCRQAGFEGVVLSDRTSDYDGGRNLQFVLHKGKETVRAIESLWEGSRTFETYGEPLSFEETDRYTLRLKRERLTSDMLERYCANLGLFPYHLSFYGQAGHLLSDVRTEFQRQSFRF
ncbi:hypothetical protein GCM10029976_053030 [Kribbella albertanoniae]|uniref:Uncharacterized protein n=1 Tax=Kribbella albertanoniae TaxID=1266829 RepID=A0A4R4P3N9_9ACTN|nr:hypothetical protein [Kribbella albertanoniae]TDC16615.1 hypothetical protein E1261_38660 [Kribbella albertanoniae]